MMISQWIQTIAQWARAVACAFRVRTTARVSDYRKEGVEKAIALSLIVCGLWIIHGLTASPLAIAETWVMVTKSDTTLEQQYVDADSITSLGSSIQLKTYWGFLDRPDSINYATTEYRCEAEEYRDVVVNGKETGMDWESVDDDTLNRAAMMYGCKQMLNQLND
ncbi:MAG: hypothetical protein AAFU78_22635 [Cyanobacteria bacterium J06633_2]